jgi:hypothetical protein
MEPDAKEQLSSDELLHRSQQLREEFAALTRVLETAGFPVGDDALATAGLSRPRLHELYTPEEGVAAFGNGAAEWLCDDQFAVLPDWVLAFFTVGDPAAGPSVEEPNRIAWRPGRLDYEPADDEYPWLPQTVRPDSRPRRDYAQFLRRAGDERYLYAGRAGLGSWYGGTDRPVAHFSLRERLPRAAWERFGGYVGWRVRIGRRCEILAPGDTAGLERLLADLGPGDSLSLTRHEGDSLSLTLTAERGHVLYSEADGQGSRVAHDPAVAADSQVTVPFPDDQGGWEAPLRDTVPRADAVAAALEFVRTGRPPVCVGEPPPPPPPPAPPPPGPRVGMHTEPEWRAETDPERLFISVSPHPGFALFGRLGRGGRPPIFRLDDRKFWLLAVACCRRVWQMSDERSQRMVEVVERWADSQGTDAERAAAAPAAHQAWVDTSRYHWGRDAAADAAHRALHATTTAGAELARTADGYEPGRWAEAVAHMVLIETARALEPEYRNSPERPAQAELIRCLAGNPFRPVVFDPAWRTEAVTGLAQVIYRDRVWDLLPMLADALEDAGCADADVLAHCRSGGPHARGCWVVDAVLGRGPAAPPSG